MTLGLATLIVVGANTESIAAPVSAAAQGLAVLLVASFGLWLITRAPFRRGP